MYLYMRICKYVCVCLLRIPIVSPSVCVCEICICGQLANWYAIDAGLFVCSVCNVCVETYIYVYRYIYIYIYIYIYVRCVMCVWRRKTHLAMIYIYMYMYV